MWTGRQQVDQVAVTGEEIVKWDKECRKIRAMEKRNNRKTKRWDS